MHVNAANSRVARVVTTSQGAEHAVGASGDALASRKGFEPLTYGLGNRCSILLSYREAVRRGRPEKSGAGRASVA